MRQIYEIAKEIKTLWENPFYGAKPYLDAMAYLGSINDYYGADSAKDIVLYFLSNARTWKGEDARRIKAELKELQNAVHQK